MAAIDTKNSKHRKPKKQLQHGEASKRMNRLE